MNLLKRVFVFFLFGMSIFVNGQESDTLKSTDSTRQKSKGTFLAIPMVNNNPVMDTGFGGMGLYFFEIDEEKTSPPSLLSILAIYSTNGSYIVAPMARMFWNEDKNRTFVSAATIRLNNDFDYEIEDGNINLVYSEIRNSITMEYSRKIVGEFYLGMLYFGTKTKYKFDKGTDAQNDFTENFFKENGIEDNFVSSIGLNLSYDDRDYPYYPTKGLTFSIRPKLNADWLGSDNNYVDTDYAFKYYLSLAKNKVLAFNLAGGFAWGDVPFDGYQIYGLRSNLRGYPAGKYKGRHMIATQAEYRWNFYKRWGAVGFAGSGRVWGNENNGEESFEQDWLPSVGGGIRYMVSSERKINIRLDYAWGIDGNQGIYFGVMEAF